VVEKVLPLATGHPTFAVRCLAGKRAAPPEDIGGFPGYEMLLEVLAEKAAGKRKRLPSEYAGLGKFDPEEFPLADYNHDLGLLSQIVAAENKMLAEYIRQVGARPLPPRPAFDAQEMLDAMMTVMKARFPEPSPKPKKPGK
jgi:hypothetical protein